MSDYTPEQIAEMAKAAKEAEKLKAELDKAAKDRDEYKAKFEENIKDRDAAKERERKALEDQKNYEAALKLKDDQYKSEIEAREKKIAEFEAERKAADEAAKKAILEKFPEDLRDEYKDFDTASLRKIEKLIEKEDGTPDMHNGKPTKPKGGAKLPSQMSREEQLAYINTNGADAFTKLIQQEQAAKK